MNIETIKKELATTFEVDELNGKFIVHAPFYCACQDDENIAVCIVPREDDFYITDMCQTYEKLEESGIIMDDKENVRRLEQILEYSLAAFDPETKELYVETRSGALFSSVYRLIQTIIVAGAMNI